VSEPSPCGLEHQHRMKGNDVNQVQRQSKAEPEANLRWPREMSWPRLQLGGRCPRSATLQHAQNETVRVFQVQLQCKQPWGMTGSWPGKFSWPRVELGSRCLRPAPCGVAHKHKMKGNEVPQVPRQSKAEPVANLRWPRELSWPRVQLGGRCRSPAPCGLAQN